MESLNPGTTVYFCWYDFTKKSEHLCKGEVVDNSDWEGTQWQGYVNVRFQPPGMKAAICHHFKEDKLSLDQSSVPHDDCTLVCAKRMPINSNTKSATDAWKMVSQFKQDHWDFQHGHISTDALDEYYQLWHDAIATKRGFKEITKPYLETSAPAPVIDVKPQQPKKTTKKPKLTNIIELSLFE